MDTKRSNLSDAELITEYLNGSERSLEKLINRHQLQIFNFINSKVKQYNSKDDSIATQNTTYKEIFANFKEFSSDS